MKGNSIYYDGKNLEKILRSEYPDILNAIEKEGYNLDFLDFDIFDEIVFEDKVVGFMTFKRFKFVDNHFAINEVYIIPQFRGNGLLWQCMTAFMLFDNFEFYPRKPTKAFIKVLLKNGFAFRLSSNLVASYFKFVVSVDDVYKNPKIKRFYRNGDSPFPYMANLFDMDLCSVMFLDPVGELVKYSDFFAITEPRKYDLKKYGCRKKLKKVTEKYIDTQYAIWEADYDAIESFIEDKEDEFEEQLLVENQLGTENELDEDFIDYLNENGLSIDDGFKIRNHIASRVESGQLNLKTIFQRVFYLFEHLEDIDKSVDEFDEATDECPFCGEHITDYCRSCPSCGQIIRDIDFEEHARDNLKASFEKLMENLFSSDEVDIDPDDELFDLKSFFAVHMLDYDFDEFYEFYTSCSEDLSIEEVKDRFLDDKLNNALGSDEEFDTYFTYLVHYFYYNQQTEKYDDAFVNFIQMAILASNKAKDKDAMMISNPHKADIIFAIGDLENTNMHFNVSGLFKKAVDSFKIDKYSNNHEEILREIQAVF